MLSTIDSFRSDLFAGQKIFVSGGSSGIGLALAKGFAAFGGDVVATGTSEAKLKACREDSANRRIAFVNLDVRDAAAIDEHLSKLDRLDVLVNAAGVLRIDDPFNEVAYLDVLNVNLHGALRMAIAGQPLLAKSGGSIINIVSMARFTAGPAMLAYTASKSALKGLTHTLAHQFGREGIRVNAIAPGFHKTDMSVPLWVRPCKNGFTAAGR